MKFFEFRNKITFSVFFVVLFLCFFCLSKSANAAIYYWVGGTTNSNISNPANWNTSPGPCADSANTNVPGASDYIFFYSNCVNNATADTSFSITNTLLNTGYTGTVTISGTTISASGTLIVNSGNLNIQSGGTFTSSLNANNAITVSSGAGTSGTITVTGSGSRLIQSNIVSGTTRIRVGDSGGTGTLNIQNGATATLGNMYIGYAADAIGVVTIDGTGTVVNSSSLANLEYIGRQGTGSLTISGGAVLNSGAGPMQIGGLAGSNGTVTVTGSGSQLNLTNTSGNLRVGYAGTGTLNVQNGGSVVVATGGTAKITVADQATATGTINIGSGYTLDSISTPGFYTGSGTASMPPVTTTTITGTGLSGSSISWDWPDQSTATGYKVYRASDDVLLTTISSATSNWTQDSLSENTAYSIYYRGTNSRGEGSASSDASSYTLADTPSGLSGVVGVDNINLSADSFLNDTTGSSGYYFSSSGGTNSGWIQSNSWNDSNLNCNRDYTYSVKYRNQAGTETSSVSIGKSTNACGGGISLDAFKPPSVPQGGFKIQINNSAPNTNNRKVNLKTNAGPDIKKIAISMTGDFTDSAQQDYTPSIEWDLCSSFAGKIEKTDCPSGTYTVYAKFYTEYGQSSSPLSSSIKLTKNIETSDKPTLMPDANALPLKPIFTKPLYFGLRSDDVRRLQTLFATRRDIYPSGLVTGYFGELTKQAVQNFQLQYGVLSSASDVGYGYVGPKTRSKIQSVFADN